MKNQAGQVMVEFALCVIIFFTFTFGLITLASWTAIDYWTQESAHAVARKYAVHNDVKIAKEAGKIFPGGLANLVLSEAPKDSDITVTDNGQIAIATVTAYPRIKSLFIFEMPYMTREAEAVLEDHRVNPSDYKGRVY